MEPWEELKLIGSCQLRKSFGARVPTKPLCTVCQLISLGSVVVNRCAIGVLLPRDFTLKPLESDRAIPAELPMPGLYGALR